MPGLAHLILPRVQYEQPRRKVGFGRQPTRNYQHHGRQLQKQVDEVLTSFLSRRRPEGIRPDLILRVKLDPKAAVEEGKWEQCGLTLLSVEKDKTLVLFSSDKELEQFRTRLAKYRRGPKREDQKTSPYNSIFACIDEIGEVLPKDRIGPLFRAEGINDPTAINSKEIYTVDVELWYLGTINLCRQRVKEIRGYIESKGGKVTEDYIGYNLVLMRTKCRGEIVRDLLRTDSIAMIDLPPQPRLSVAELLQSDITNFPDIDSPGDDAPAIGVLDSGITSAHPLLAPAVGEATTIPSSWRDASDAHGHGTMVSGLALYHDVERCINSRSFVPHLKLFSARVLNQHCQFDDEHLITSQMRESIHYFNQKYGCRVFNLSLGDPRLPYLGGKVGPWATVLDAIARDLNILIVVSAGNYEYDPGQSGNPISHLRDYPRYLLSTDARIIEPATGAIVLTVGSLSHTTQISQQSTTGTINLRPIALKDQPSPFTRSGPGLGDAIKPELVEYGGNVAYDAHLSRARYNPPLSDLSIISLNRNYVSRLFTANIGTSFAAPRVAHCAAMLLGSFPDASANLLRALLVSSASLPRACSELLDPIDRQASIRICGYGVPDLEHAQRSDENRVVLYADQQLGFDNFHIFELPIPGEFIDTNGKRHITVTLAFDPPVRHTRFDYLGVKMSFRLIRGKSLEEVVEAFRKPTPKNGEVERFSSTRYDCNMIPGSQAREGGTLQRATFRMRINPREDYGDTYYLVVRCERKWAQDEQGPQRYAVVVVVEHTANVNLYNTIRQRVRAAIRIRARRVR